MKYEIKSMSGGVLYTADIPDDTDPSAQARAAVEAAVCAAANLRGANLRYANLRYANLSDANLRYADLSGANLSGAYLSGANLRGANLRYADLSDADLSDAKIDDARTLVGERPVVQIGQIGSRNDVLIGYVTDDGVMIRAGCWYGTLADFRTRVVKVHGESRHAQQYLSAATFAELHAGLWGAEA